MMAQKKKQHKNDIVHKLNAAEEIKKSLRRQVQQKLFHINYLQSVHLIINHLINFHIRTPIKRALMSAAPAHIRDLYLISERPLPRRGKVQHENALLSFYYPIKRIMQTSKNTLYNEWGGGFNYNELFADGYTCAYRVVVLNPAGVFVR